MRVSAVVDLVAVPVLQGGARVLGQPGHQHGLERAHQVDRVGRVVGLVEEAVDSQLLRLKPEPSKVTAYGERAYRWPAWVQRRDLADEQVGVPAGGPTIRTFAQPGGLLSDVRCGDERAGPRQGGGDEGGGSPEGCPSSCAATTCSWSNMGTALPMISWRSSPGGPHRARRRCGHGRGFAGSGRDAVGGGRDRLSGVRGGTASVGLVRAAVGAGSAGAAAGVEAASLTLPGMRGHACVAAGHGVSSAC